ncbi:hypothetical protein Egran_03239, partial [Elaphomyces granulatus]
MSFSSNPFVRRTARRHRRQDYQALNNGMDSLRSESSTDVYAEDYSSHSSSESPRAISLERELSPQDNPMSSEAISLTQETPPPPPSSSLPTNPRLGKRKERKDKSYSSWAHENFWITELDKTWSRKGGPLKKDRLLVCKKFSWSSTDSARHGSTSNLLTHLQTKHRIKPTSAGAPSAPNTSIDRFLTTRQPFTAVEHPAFRALFAITETNLPIKTADTLRNRIETEFCKERSRLRQELDSTCKSIALSLDGWTSENQVGILAVIGHWTTPEFEKKEALLEFTEIHGPHSGESMTEILLAMLEDFRIAPKLLTITGDNAGNNGTLCNYLHSELLKKYDDDDDQFRSKQEQRL